MLHIILIHIDLKTRLIVKFIRLLIDTIPLLLANQHVEHLTMLLVLSKSTTILE